MPGGSTRTKTTWLSAEEQRAWRAYQLMTHLLDDALDRQLLQQAGMPHVYYGILVTLSEAPGQSLRMSELASVLRHSPSRMTHAIRSMESNGWVRRAPCPTDRRGQVAKLTAAGRRALEGAAPGHVAEVRSRVFDRLTDAQVEQLREICETLLDGLDPVTRPEVDADDRTGASAAGPSA